MIINVFGIKWDNDGEDVDIPTTMNIDIPDDLDETEINDYLSDEISNIAGWCHHGFQYKHASP